jgi:uncharacterized protein YndB with AHSA1/START domain
MSRPTALVVRRQIRAPVARVFDAWIQPQQLRQWWGPRPLTCSDASVDLRVGGAYRIGNLFPDGSVVWISGEFEIVEPPFRLVYTWHVERKESPIADRSRVTVRFQASGDGTEVIVVHERIDTEETRADHEKGWNGCLDGLAGFFASP